MYDKPAEVRFAVVIVHQTKLLNKFSILPYSFLFYTRIKHKKTEQREDGHDLSITLPLHAFRS